MAPGAALLGVALQRAVCTLGWGSLHGMAEPRRDPCTACSRARGWGILCFGRAAPLLGVPAKTSSGPCLRAANAASQATTSEVERRKASPSTFTKSLGVPVINTGTCHRACYLRLAGPWQGGCSPPLSQSPEAEEIDR